MYYTYKGTTAMIIPSGYRRMWRGEQPRPGDLIGYAGGYYGDRVWWPVNACYHKVGDLKGLVYLRLIPRKVPNV